MASPDEYQSILSSSDPPSRHLNIPIPTVLKYFLGSDVRPSGRICHRGRPRELAYGSATANLKFSVNPESIRFIAYLCFWGMCIFSILMTKYVTAGILAKGSLDGSTCPPFEGDRVNGFDINTNSHLMETFGFNNICVNFDYTPSRELTAMIYPLFEYALVLYIVLDFLLTAVSYKKGYVTERLWSLAKFCFPFQLILCAVFRMIFVILAYTNVRGHTAGFLGLQFALITVTVINCLYILETKVSYRALGGQKGTTIVIVGYLVINFIISLIKLYLTAYVVFGLGLAEGNTYPPWAHTPVGSLTIGLLVDRVWMIFNAIIPVFVSFIRSRSEPDLVFTIGLEDMTQSIS